MDFYGSICLDDIDVSTARQGKNGKLYLSIEVKERKEPSQFGQTHYIQIARTKEQREAQEPVRYIGELKPSVYNQQAAPMQPFLTQNGMQNVMQNVAQPITQNVAQQPQQGSWQPQQPAYQQYQQPAPQQPQMGSEKGNDGLPF